MTFDASDRPVSERLARSAATGLGMGFIYFLLGFVSWVMRGNALSDISGVQIAALARVFLIGGTVMGAMVGILEPLITSHIRAIAVFAIAAIPVGLWIKAVFYASSPDDPAALVIGFAMFVGGIGGTAYWQLRGASGS